MKILITGGAGYIGSSIAGCCADEGITPVILDDYSTGLRSFAAPYDHYEGDIADQALLTRIVREHPEIDAVIHCAAKIVVPESVAEPLDYYENNVVKTITLMRTLAGLGVKRFIFSSSASLYTESSGAMVDESSEVEPNSPYAATKFMCERILRDFAATGAMRALVLRYFNPIGADPKMRCGLQKPHPTHALGKMIEAHRAGESFTVTGTDWPTRDGSGLRDYVHVNDLARAHVAAVRLFDKAMSAESEPGFSIINLGTGSGTTVLEFARAFQEATGSPLAIEEGPRRPGDVCGCATLIDRAREVLGWVPQYRLVDGIQHSLEFAQRLPAVLRSESVLVAEKKSHHD